MTGADSHSISNRKRA